MSVLKRLGGAAAVAGLARLSQLAAKNRSNSRFSGVWCRKVGTTEWTVIMLPEYRLL